MIIALENGLLRGMSAEGALSVLRRSHFANVCEVGRRMNVAKQRAKCRGRMQVGINLEWN